MGAVQAYKRAALRWHPDKVIQDERDSAEVKFKQVTTAHAILSDPAKRQRYDAGVIYTHLSCQLDFLGKLVYGLDAGLHRSAYIDLPTAILEASLPVKHLIQVCRRRDIDLRECSCRLIMLCKPDSTSCACRLVRGGNQ